MHTVSIYLEGSGRRLALQETERTKTHRGLFGEDELDERRTTTYDSKTGWPEATTTRYDQQGRESEQRKEDAFGNTHTEKYKYGPNGQKIVSEEIDMERAKGTSTDTKYSDQHQLLEKETKYADGRKPEIEAWLYDAKGKLALHTKNGEVVDEGSTSSQSPARAEALSDGSNPQLDRAAPITDKQEQAIVERYQRGESLSLKEFLSLPAGVCPVVDAYNSGKSPTLNHEIDRMKNCPWADQIKIKTDGSGQSEYNSDTKTLHINRSGQLSDESWIARFAHESYHASHQDMHKLYLDHRHSGSHGELSNDEYVKIKMDQEAHSWVDQIETQKQLGSAYPVVFVEAKQWGPIVTVEPVNMTELYEKEGYEGVRKFLATHHPLKMDHGNKAVGESYAEYYGNDRYKLYQKNFDKDKKEAQSYLDKFRKQHHTEKEYEDWGY